MLNSKATLLRHPCVSDIAVLSKLRNDSELQTQLLSLPRANSEKRVSDWVENILSDPQSLFFIIADRQDNRPLGFVQVRRMDFVHGNGELGICLEREAQGKGHAREAIALVEAHSKQVFRLRKILIQVLASNDRAIRCYEKCGYDRVGIMREHFFYAGCFHDVLIMEHKL
ncbi:hypothetical protein AYO44_05230 [Planctomycetaceae bacterium SCGC AG-212-F19]|nr:hypothetical protein AYO44_05230 [Planctomycetaceae bacterium SCGC AG-212-F19]